ncbi:MAG: hypothetical protein KDK37_17515 [Leptospiraceae bacterium]|nr:hypothetical protein [Leptospiraceae bacterium]MCB1306092.1 hypothetical protein [Leptospiraceae bacterium]
MKFLQLFVLIPLIATCCPDTEIEDSRRKPPEEMALPDRMALLENRLEKIEHWQPTFGEQGPFLSLSTKGGTATLDIEIPKQTLIGTYKIQDGNLHLAMKVQENYSGTESRPMSVSYLCEPGFRDHPYLARVYIDCQIVSEPCKTKDQSFECHFTSRFRLFAPGSANPKPIRFKEAGYTLINQGLHQYTVNQDAILRSGPGINFPEIPIINCMGLERYPAGYSFIAAGRTLEPEKLLDTSDYWYYGFVFENDCVHSSVHPAWIYGGLLR